jgi:chromosome segregation ATPase
VSRQLEDARAEVSRLTQELDAVMACTHSDGEASLRRRIEELEKEADEGRKELTRLRGVLSGGEGREERIQALGREMELVGAARQRLQETVQLQKDEIARLVDQ